MKKAVLIGLLAVLWLALKLMTRWFGSPGVQNPAVDLALLVITAVAAVAVGVWLMKTEATEESKKNTKPLDNTATPTTPPAPRTAAQAATSEPVAARVEAPMVSRVPDDRGTVFCAACGAASQGGKFCQECGRELQRKTACPQCGAAFQDGAKFCRECGTRVA